MSYLRLALAFALIGLVAGRTVAAPDPLARGAAIPARSALELPGSRELLASVPGRPGAPGAGRARIAAAAAVRTTGKEGTVLRVALVVIGELAPGQAERGAVPPARLILARQAGARMIPELDVVRSATGAHSLNLGPFRPGGQLALAVHWAVPATSGRGPAEVFVVDEKAARRIWSGGSEGLYFRDVAGRGHDQLVHYPPPDGSAVALPDVLDWDGDRLAPSPSSAKGLHEQLLADCAEVVDSWLADRPGGVPPRIVVDAALLKGRVLEREGRREEALAAYRCAAGLLVGCDLSSVPAEERQELEQRVEESARRAASGAAGAHPASR